MPIITLSEAIELVAGTLNKDARQNRKEILRILDRAQEEAWNRGLFWGFYREMKVRVWGDHIVLPQDFSVLYAVNVNGSPAMPRNRWYEFHQNGHGSLEDCFGDNSCKWVRSVVDLGEQAVPWQPCGKKLQVRSRGCEDGLFMTVAGTDQNEEPIYSYWVKDAESNGTSCSSCDGRCYTREEVDSGAATNYETEYGERFPILNGKIIETANYFSTIESIRKPVTKSPIDIYVVNGSEAEFLLTMAPHETSTSFRKYRLPDSCSRHKCVHVLGKIAEPQPLAHDSQPLIIQSRSALINLAISAEYRYEKKMPLEADVFLESGLKQLDLQNAERTGPRNMAVQVMTPDVGTFEPYEFRPSF